MDAPRSAAVFAFGLVQAVDAATGRARVQFLAEDGVVSWWLFVLQPSTQRNQYYRMPDVGEHVACLLDRHAEDGVILGAIFSERDVPPVTTLDLSQVTYKDGTVVAYNRATHALAVTVAAGGSVTVHAERITLGGEGAQALMNAAAAALLVAHSHPSNGAASPGLIELADAPNLTTVVQAQ